MDEIVMSVINGQVNAFNQLVEIEKPKLLSKAYSITGNWEDASDIVQEVLFKAYKSIKQLKEPKYFSTWLFKILIRECFVFLKQRKRTLVIETEVLKQYIEQLEQPPANYEFVHEALSHIKDEYRTVLVLFYFYHFKIKDIAHMLDTPVNTVKVHLLRGRNELKKQIEQYLNKPIQKKEVVSMLKEHLEQLALKFVSVPAHYQIIVEDFAHNEAKFIWGAPDLEETMGITLDNNGKLLELSKPISHTGITLSSEKKKLLAEKFLSEHHKEALDYLTLSEMNEQEESTRFIYEQYVGGYPLASFYTKIIVANNGEIVEFNYNGFTKNPPVFPNQLIEKKTILQQVKNADWSLSLQYLSNELYSVPKSGLYPIYESSVIYQSFDAKTGKPKFEHEKDEEKEYIPFPQTDTYVKKQTTDEMIGITEAMEQLREIEIDDDTIAIVWREKDWQSKEDKTMENFLRNRMEDTVKAKLNKHTKELKEFIWFKERNGDLELSFEDCQTIAINYIATYFKQYVPYLYLSIQEKEFNDVGRAFFTFPLHDGHGLIIDRERFYVAVNRTTGLIDILWSPKIDFHLIQEYRSPNILPVDQALPALKDIDLFLKWSKQYKDDDETYEILEYEIGHVDTKRAIAGIDAVSGKLIVKTY